MITARTQPLLRYLHKVAGASPATTLSDGQLLARFAEQRDEAAFEILLARHGPMVLGVCRRILSDWHAAEDAFQATFLVLTRKCRGIGHGELLGPWLFRVAYVTAVRARARTAQRSFHERRVMVPRSNDPLAEVVWRDLAPVLDAEVNRLPAKYQQPFVLCYLEGKTNEEAARQLHWPTGTVKIRLARARARLQQCLLRRGVSLSAVGLTGLLVQEQARAAVPAGLLRATTGRLLATGVVSESVTLLANGVLKALWLTKLKLAAMLLTVWTVSLGSYLAWSAQPTTSQTSAGAPAPAPGKLGTVDPKQLFDQAVNAFFVKEDMAAAEKGFQAVVDHAATTSELKNQALFYLHASLHRQERHRDAIKVAQQWLTLYPKDKTRNYVLLFQGISHEKLGDLAKAKACWQDIIKTAPDSDLAKSARFHLDGSIQSPKPSASADRYEPGRVMSADAGKSGAYLVVAVALDENKPDHRQFKEVASRVAEFHHGQVVACDGKDFDRLQQVLKQHMPRNVLFVIPPEKLDIVFHRRIVLLSAALDTDPFADFAFGYLTARDGPALAKLWQRTLEVHKHGLKSRVWLGTAVASKMQSAIAPDHLPETARAAGFKGQTYFFGSVEADPKVLAFAGQHLPELKDAGVICLSGNGDPEGIWLFDDRRNSDRSKHWPYDPARVGHDPKGEMPRLTAEHWAALGLQSPIVWSGTCHSAAPRRVYVEEDIVSTFGRTDTCTVHHLDPKKSLCLAVLDAGAVAFLAPIAANHGYSSLCEQDFALIHGATLGEVIKSTYDDVFLASRGHLRLDIPQEGQKQRHEEQIMQGGGANRLLIGDPALAPFKSAAHPQEKVEIRKRTSRGCEVVVTWQAGFHAWAWDLFGTDHGQDWRIAARVPLNGLVPEGKELKLSATVEARDQAGQPLPFVLKHAEPETYHGQRYLHLRANANRKGIERQYVHAVFTVTWE